MKQESKNFSLKDQLFNRDKVTYIAGLISDASPSFQTTQFIDEVLGKFPELELMERIHHIVDMLEKYLVHSDNTLDYPASLNILLWALPPELDPDKHDDDFGEFILAPYGAFVAKYGCSEVYLGISLDALEQMTKRFSSEFPIRVFLNTFPEPTFQKMITWSQSDNYHVRRLASEWTRSNLPWGQKIDLEYRRPLQILDTLAQDDRRFVTRSVANHMNDIAKIDPELVVTTLKKWQPKKFSDIDYIILHSTRTLVKNGFMPAFDLLWYHASPKLEMSELQMTHTSVQIGTELEFSFQLDLQQPEKLMIDYTIHFIWKTGKTSAKVFKLKKGNYEGKVDVIKKHPLKLMTTKSLYPWEHILEISINGRKMAKKIFTLTP